MILDDEEFCFFTGHSRPSFGHPTIPDLEHRTADITGMFNFAQLAP
ncbi:MAG TPA: hypothetical protein VN843_02700 [Anaerolineales bacterium]|nr:hypothetical protein [Anaerolineales bacterium]